MNDNTETPDPQSSKSYTVTFQGQVYELTDSLRERIESWAEREYNDNDFLDYYWRVADNDDEDHNTGDPILCIETSGPYVPWDRLSELEVDVEEQEPLDLTDNDTTDNGNGTQTVDPDSNSEGEENDDDTKLMMTPEDYRQVPDPNDGDMKTLPPEPAEYLEEEPAMFLPVPEIERDERWAAGRTIAPMYTTVEWNVQQRIDSRPSIAGRLDDRPHTENVAEKWERLFAEEDCPVVGEATPQNPPTEDDTNTASTAYDEQQDIGGRYGGDNFSV